MKLILRDTCHKSVTIPSQFYDENLIPLQNSDENLIISLFCDGIMMELNFRHYFVTEISSVINYI